LVLLEVYEFGVRIKTSEFYSGMKKLVFENAQLCQKRHTFWMNFWHNYAFSKRHNCAKNYAFFGIIVPMPNAKKRHLAQCPYIVLVLFLA